MKTNFIDEFEYAKLKLNDEANYSFAPAFA